MAQDTSEDYFFWMLWRWEEHQRVTYFPSQPCTAIPRRGTHTKDWWDTGRDGGEVRGQGQMSCSQREKHIAFHQPPEKEVIHNSVDTIWPWMCELGVRCHHAATGRQVKKKKKCHFSPDYLTAQERITDWGSMVKGEKGHTKDNKKGNLNPPAYATAAAAHLKTTPRANLRLFSLKHKSTLKLC